MKHCIQDTPSLCRVFIHTLLSIISLLLILLRPLFQHKPLEQEAWHQNPDPNNACYEKELRQSSPRLRARHESLTYSSLPPLLLAFMCPEMPLPIKMRHVICSMSPTCLSRPHSPFFELWRIFAVIMDRLFLRSFPLCRLRAPAPTAVK
jgi:hypothetical protein